MSHGIHARIGKGFTLLEVLVALTILALAMGALIKTTAGQTALLADLEERVQGFLVANNRLHRMQAERQWPKVGTSKDTVEQGGRRWHWLTLVDNTPDPDLRRVVIEVRLTEDGPPITRLTGFLARPR